MASLMDFFQKEKYSLWIFFTIVVVFINTRTHLVSFMIDSRIDSKQRVPFQSIDKIRTCSFFMAFFHSKPFGKVNQK